jgi:hypothetical protein
LQYLYIEQVKSLELHRGSRVVKILTESDYLRKYKNKRVKPGGELKEVSEIELPEFDNIKSEIDYRIKLEQVYDLVETPQKINQNILNLERKRYRVIIEKLKKTNFETDRKILEEKLFIKIQPHAPRLGKKLILEVIPLVSRRFKNLLNIHSQQNPFQLASFVKSCGEIRFFSGIERKKKILTFEDKGTIKGKIKKRNY